MFLLVCCTFSDSYFVVTYIMKHFKKIILWSKYSKIVLRLSLVPNMVFASTERHYEVKVSKKFGLELFNFPQSCTGQHTVTFSKFILSENEIGEFILWTP